MNLKRCLSAIAVAVTRCLNARRSMCRGVGAVAALVVVAGLTVTAMTPEAAAGNATSKVVAGLVDVDLTMGYAATESEGSGIVLTAAGDVLTNNHLIVGATTIRVKDLGNGHAYLASVVGYDIVADVAVLHLKGASKLATAPIGNSLAVKIGAAVSAMGNTGGPGGTSSSTSGKVTALNQSLTASSLGGTSEHLTGLIETSAVAGSGYAGGALVEATDNVIGMVTAESDGASFAIPINTAMSIVRQIESGHFSGNVHRGATAFLGVEVKTAPASSAHASALVAAVVSGSPAARAGIVSGDVITRLSGRQIASAKELTDAVLAQSPGEKVQVGWVDHLGGAHSATVTLASGPPE